MKVIIDWVANHTGYDHQWTKEHADWYRKDEHGNFTELYGWVDVIDLNYEIPALRRGMIAAMKHWVLSYDIDGFRCDMASPERGATLDLSRLNERVKPMPFKPEFIVVANSIRPSSTVATNPCQAKSA